jgi:hypothetical protein
MRIYDLKLTSLALEQLICLTPVTEEEWDLFETFDCGDVGLYTRCIECKQSDFIAFYVHHRPGCTTAKRIATSIASLSDEAKADRRRQERYL